MKNKKLDEALRHLRETQAQAVQAEKMASIGQLAAGVAHEINNPIGFIGSNLEALADYFQDYETLLDRYRNLGTMIFDNGKADPGEIQAIRELEQELEIEYLKDDIPELLQDCIDGTRRVGRIVADLKNFAHPGNDRQMLIDINQGLESTLNVVANELKYKATLNKSFKRFRRWRAFPETQSGLHEYPG